MSIAQLLTIMNARFFIAVACYFCLYTSNNVQATPNLSSAEYFIDTTPWFGGNETTICDNDPVPGRGIALDPTDDVWDATIESAQLDGIDTSQLAPGTYDLCVRFKDNTGQWGATRLTHFTLTTAVGIQTTSPLSAAEYFIDTTPWFGGNETTICNNDPGPGRGIALDPTDDAWDSTIESAQLAGIDTSQLAPGTYDLCVRFKDSTGQWGKARLTHFTVLTTGDDTATKLNDAEYFIDSTPWFGGNETMACDNDPGPGNGIALEPIDGTWDSSVETVQLTAIETSQLTPGIHDLCVRFQDSNGEWGTARLTHLNLIRGLSACEYYIDQDPGLAHGQNLPAKDGIFNNNQELLETGQISIANLIMGTHTVGARCQDEWGRWGNVTTKDFLIVIPAITVTTSAATNISQTSATLNGTVMSSSAVATVNFEFGTTASYGQTVAAIPAQVYSATAVAVTAAKTGLTCNTTYHYRAKAISTASTGLGLDQTFTTATCPPITYAVTPSLTPVNGGTVTPNVAQTIAKNATASFTVTANSGYTRNNAVSGTCPQGTWNNNVWKTGLITANCSVNFSFTFVPQPVNGVCGSANGSTFTTVPTTNLCSAGTASVVTGTGPWNWTCAGSNGGTNASCTANINRYTATASAGTGGTVNPSTATVNYGTAASFTVTANSGYTRNNAVSGTCPQGTWNNNVWKTGPIIANCTVNFGFTFVPQLVNGVCGSANGSTFTTVPTTNLCNAGTASAVTGTGPWNWTCAGSNGGTTASCSANLTTTSVNAWLNPPSSTIIRDTPLALGVIVKSNSMLVSSYKFTVTIDPTKLQFDTAYQNAAQSCYFGICPGTNALNSNIVDDTDSSAGTLVLIGQDAQGKGPGNDLQLLVMHLKTKTTVGATPVTLTINKLQNPSGGTIGLQARGATVTVSHGLCGDSDGNAAVNIVDALSIARKLVGLPPPPTVDVTLADTNENARLDINDALMIARYSIGLVIPPEACNIGQPL